jgi:hypothetical protein
MTPEKPVERLVGLPKPWLDADACLELNQAFYSVEPHDYFNTRLILLMLAAAAPNAILEAYKQGLEYGALKRGGPGTQRTEGPEGDAAHVAFVAADSVNLLHHVSETLMRFYLAHRPDSGGKFRASPWLEIANEVNPAAFKRLVGFRFDGTPLTDARRAEVTATFYGAPKPPASVKQGERLKTSVEEIERYLQHFARYFVDEAMLYNSMKHGLAVRSGTSSMRIETPADMERAERDEPPLISADGPSVEYLARESREDPYRRVTRWFRPDVLMAEAQMAVYMLEQIWSIGKLRYVDRAEPPAQIALRFYDQTPLKHILDVYLDGQPARIVTTRMEMDIGYTYAYPPKLECTACGRGPRDDEERPRRDWRAISDDQSPLRVVCPACATAWRAARTTQLG